MAFTQPMSGNNLTSQQLGELIKLLAQQPQANPASSQFDANYWSKLVSLSQPSVQQEQQPVQQVQPTQETQQNATRFNIVRIADDPSTIKVQEVEMGVTNLFPSSDGSKIFAKEWTNDGLIKPSVYVLQDTEASPPLVPVDPQQFEEMQERIAKLEATVAKLKKQQSSKPVAKSKPKTKTAPSAPPPATTTDDEFEGGNYNA